MAWPLLNLLGKILSSFATRTQRVQTTKVAWLPVLTISVSEQYKPHKNMTSLKFVNAHHQEWKICASELTNEYFYWMNDQIEMTCHFSISDIVGMPLEAYITATADLICPHDQIHAKFYLLVKNETPVAMGGLRQLPNGDAEIVRVYTKPEFRGMGLGKAVLERLISDARKSGFGKLKLDTAVFMKQAQSLYASHGFTECAAYDGAEPPAQLFPYWHFMELKLR